MTYAKTRYEADTVAGIWQGEFSRLTRSWLRWYRADGLWILTDGEAQKQRADRLAAKLRELGVAPDSV